MKKIESKDLLKLKIGLHYNSNDILKLLKKDKDIVFDVFKNELLIIEYTEREETEVEIKEREKLESERIKNIEIKEKETLKRLKEKYEKNNNNK